MDILEWGWLEKLFEGTYDMLSDPISWVKMGSILFKIILIYVGARIAVSLLKKTVEKIFRERKSGALSISEKRSKTLVSLLHNVIVNVTYFIAIIMILDELGFPLAALLAGAGVVGLAIGFGAQNLVKDVITGFFIIYEDQFSVGDFIKTGVFSGTVQEIGLRVTKIKEWTGEVHMIPNGNITQVSNFSKENSMAVLNITVAYEENIAEVENKLDEILKEVYQQNEDIVAEPSVLGLQDMKDSKMVIGVAAECKPMTHFAVARQLRRIIKSEFKKVPIEIPQ